MKTVRFPESSPGPVRRVGWIRQMTAVLALGLASMPGCHTEELPAELATLRGDLEKLQSQVKEIEEQLGASSGGAGLSEADVAALKAASDASQSQVDTLTRERDAAKADANTLRDQLSTAETQKKSLELDLASARSDRSASQSQVSALTRERDDAQSRVAALTRERDAARSEVATLRGQLASAQALKQAVDRQLSAAETRVESLERDLASARSGRDAAQSQVSALTRERDAVKADANTLRGQLAPGPSSRPTEVVSLGSGVSMTLVEIPAGRFTMGSPASEPGRDSDETQREVTISKAFWLGQTEVTQAQWAAVMGTNPSNFKGNPSHPVEQVSWEDAQAFCRKLSEKTGKKFRLPTEAEWEYACRAGTVTAYSFGDDAGALGEHAWFKDNSGGSTKPVATRKANAWGLYDMHGNVWEWCSDWYGAYAGGAQTDPTGPRSGTSRVLRGGSWGFDSRFGRAAGRIHGDPDNRDVSYAFRVARTP